MLSILIPAYNAGPFIGELLEQLISLVPGGAECIIYDDGSNDDTCEVARRFKRVRVQRGNENRGSGYARNKLLALASGNVVHFLDADDPPPDKGFYEKLSPLVTEATAAFCAWRIISKSGDVREKKYSSDVEVNWFHFFLGDYVHLNATLFPREFLLKYGGV